MNMQTRCKGTHSFEDIFSLQLAGGKMLNPESDNPTFVFPSDVHYSEYKRHKRKLKEAGERGSTEQSDKPAGRSATRNEHRWKLGSKHYM
jgi:hypothetical protein